MSKHRCSQCDKELPPSWSQGANANWDPVCPECASRDLKKQSLRRRRILDTSVRKKPNLEIQPEPTASAQSPTQVTTPPQAPAVPHPQAEVPASGKVSLRAHLPMDIELDTDDPLLLAAQNAEAEEEEKDVDPMEETTQIRKPKPPQGPQVRLNF
jgi:hypothetical protein